MIVGGRLRRLAFQDCDHPANALHFCRMKELVVALAQVNVTVGALIPNTSKMIRESARAVEQGAGLVVFPECAVSGYPPEDLVLKKHFLEDCEIQLARLARQLPPEAVVVVGCPRLLNGKAFNTAVIFHGGREMACYRKMALPNYGVFDEKRVFEPGNRALILELDGWRIGWHICEDSWHTDQLSCQLLRDRHLDVLFNMSASPYHRGKIGIREQRLREIGRFLKAGLFYCNLVGGQDELVFDGASLALDTDGKLIARARQFTDDLLLASISAPAAPRPAGPEVGEVEVVKLQNLPSTRPTVQPRPVRIEPTLEDAAEVYAALKLGLRDYVDKNGFQKVVVGVSGGIDSALVATLAVDALGPDRVVGVTMPSSYSSRETLADAGHLAERLGIRLLTLPIQRIYQTYLEDLAALWGEHPLGVTEENLQARIRGNLIMALSNRFGWLVLTTGNKSELATGYCTLYGDMVGGFAVIKDVPKTLVYELVSWRNRQGATPIIPASIFERPPSAELRPNQKDTDSLPPYDVLDAILERYVEHDEGVDAIVAAGFDPATVHRVARMVDRSEYKRRQGAPGIKITPKAFGRDRRMPITNLYDERGAGGGS